MKTICVSWVIAKLMLYSAHLYLIILSLNLVNNILMKIFHYKFQYIRANLNLIYKTLIKNSAKPKKIL